MFCENCGYPVETTDRFCQHCGTQISNTNIENFQVGINQQTWEEPEKNIWNGDNSGHSAQEVHRMRVIGILGFAAMILSFWLPWLRIGRSTKVNFSLYFLAMDKYYAIANPVTLFKPGFLAGAYLLYVKNHVKSTIALSILSFAPQLLLLLECVDEGSGSGLAPGIGMLVEVAGLIAVGISARKIRQLKK